jgi:hypothetical protein
MRGKVFSAAMIVLLAGGAPAMAQGHDHGQQGAQSAPAAGTRTASPKGAEVYFHYPIDDIRVPERFTVRIGMRGMGVAPAGIDKANTGHHHLLIDVDKVDLNQPIPSDYNHIHLGNGQTEVVLTLKPGTHTLQLLVADHNHVPHVPPVMSKKITIYVR